MARYGAGTVYPRQTPQGTVYIGQWYEGKDPQGKRIRRSVRADTEAAAWKAMQSQRRKPQRRKHPAGVSVGAYLARWLDVVARTRRERTLIGYRTIVRAHLLPAFAATDIAALSRKQVQAWVDKQDAHPVTIRHWIACLSAALRQARLEGLVDIIATEGITTPRAPRRAVTPMTAQEARGLIEALHGTPIGDLVALALHTGARQSELLALRWADCDLDAGTVSITRSLSRLTGGGIRYAIEAPKTERSRRSVPLAPAAVALLRERRLRASSDLVFPAADGKWADGPTVTRQFQVACHKAGIRRMTFHELRHGAASLLIASGIPLPIVSEMLGHSTITTTVDIYGHLTADSKRQAANMLGDLLSRDGGKADTSVSNTDGATRAGSTPAPGTNQHGNGLGNVCDNRAQSGGF